MRRLLYALLLVLLPSAPVVAQPTDPLAPGEHEVELRGVSIWYLVRGDGPVLLIQPGGAGWGGDATIYIETLQPLEAAHTVVYYDPRGIGRSGRSVDPALYRLDEYVEDLEALREHLGRRPWRAAGPNCYPLLQGLDNRGLIEGVTSTRVRGGTMFLLSPVLNDLTGASR